MLKLKHTFLAIAGLMLASCAAPKAVVVEQPTAPQTEIPAPEVLAPLPEPAAFPNDGLRLPEMLDLPSEGDLRATNPPVTRGTTEDGAVISRPPTDPPARVTPAPTTPD